MVTRKDEKEQNKEPIHPGKHVLYHQTEITVAFANDYMQKFYNNR